MSSVELHESQLSWPTDWSQIFGRKAPLVIEIGFGGGHFLVDLAQKRPSTNILGLEISLPSIRRGIQKTRVAGLENVRIMQSNAWYVLWSMFELESVQAVYINFPDPWPKSGHQHRRIVSERFLHLLATRMPTGATLDIATDHADYQEAITVCIEQTPYFHSCLDSTFVTEDLERLRTKYERTAIAEGRTCHYYKWQRNEREAENVFPILKEEAMPHVVIFAPLSLAEIRDQFTSQRSSFENRHINLVELYESRDEQKLLVEAFVKEEPLSQRVGIEIQQRKNGEFMITLNELGFPRVTTGVHYAVAKLAQQVLGMHPAAQLVRHNLASEILG
ncbi:MAG: tRNA (guanosine(46)-N7)-methyltransferase TrmB [Chloroflexi bacterium]|nr:tRNA (guanosine(46)-N7)-methyltransferase TrmB [Chloroflexota bacterium]